MSIIIDPADYSIVDANKNYLNKEGLSREDIAGKKCYDITHKRTSPCRGPSDKCPMKATLKNGEISSTRHIHFDKKYNPYYVEVVTTPVKDPIRGKNYILHISRNLPATENAGGRHDKSYLDRLKSLIVKDPLTGAFNYRYLMERLPIEISRARRYEHPFSVAIIDIDFFKSINDAYGHLAGDRVIEEFAGFLSGILRNSDVLTRMGGEEFTVLMPHSDEAASQRMANRILEALGTHVFDKSENSIKVKASIGIACLSDKIFDKLGKKMLEAADNALRRAKNAGGNTVVLSSEYYAGDEEAGAAKTPELEVDKLKKKIQKMTERVDRVVLESIYAFSKSLKSRDYYAPNNSEEMVSLAMRIGRRLGLDQATLNNLEMGAMLHDIGKIGISEQILGKKGRLTPQEFNAIKVHPKVGAEIIKAIQFLKDVVPMVLYHHERFDGKGYPYGLKGDEILTAARIIGVLDAYQSLISDRPFRKAYSSRKALEIIKKESGTRFDKEIVNILLELLKQK